MERPYLQQRTKYWFHTKCGNFRLTQEGIDFFSELPKLTGPHPIPSSCPICGAIPRQGKNPLLALSIHFARLHSTDKSQLTIASHFNGIKPVCKVCSADVIHRGVTHGFKILCEQCDDLRVVANTAKKRKLKHEVAWNKGLTQETSDSVKRGTINCSKTLTKFGAWSKDLSLKKNPDNESLQKLSKNTSIGLKKFYETNESWCTGLTKENSEIIRNRGQKIHEAFVRIPLKERFSENGRRNLQSSMRRVQLLQAEKQKIPIETIIERINSINHNWTPCFSIDTKTFKPIWSIWAGELREYQCVHCKQVYKNGSNVFIGWDGEGKKCPCQKTGNSRAEFEIEDFLKLHELNVSRNNRSVISPWELDFIIPEKKLAVEFNGLYFHSEIKKANTIWYHENKRNMCVKNDYSLFHIYEDEWNNKRDIVKSMILQKLGHVQRKLHARKCEIFEYQEPGELRSWFDTNHIDGYVNSEYAFVLKENDEIVFAVLLRKPFHQRTYGDKTIEIARFASILNSNVRGAFMKLMNQIKLWCFKNGFGRILSYHDNRFGGSGDCYKRAGMTLLRTSGISWWWTNYRERVNRFEFKNKQSAANEGYYKIGGCSNEVYVLDL